METWPLENFDVLSLIQKDASISIAIVARNGEVLSYTESTPALFGTDGELNLVGKKISDIFEPAFAQERMDWIEQTIDQNKVLKVVHFFQGHRLVSTFMPLSCPDSAEDSEECHDGGHDLCVAILTRYASKVDLQMIDDETLLHTEYLDLGPLNALTQRELEVFVLLGHGYSVPGAGKTLHRSPRTIEQHKASIGRKLGISTIAQIARIVGELGLRIDDVSLTRISAVRPEYATETDAGQSFRSANSVATTP